MAILARRTAEAMTFALVAAHNQTCRATATVASFFHADVTAKTVSGDFRAPVATSAAVTAATATDLPTLLVMCEDLRVSYDLHLADGATASNCNCGAHKVPDVTNVRVAPAASDLATAVTFLNDWKAKYNLHCASTTHHYTADGTNTVATANATNLADSITLSSALKAGFNAHIISAPAVAMVKLIGP